MSQSEKSAIFVLGMHRSGTSALTRVLSLMGARLPGEILQPNAFNPKGYWEPQSIIATNDDVLDTIDASWDGPFVDASKHRSLIQSGLVDRAAKALAQAYDQSAAAIVVKDPRCTLLAEFWTRASAQAGYAARRVGIYRDFDAVARSLEVRDGFIGEETALLWCWYGVQTLKALNAENAPLISYADLTANWRSAIESLQPATGLDLAGLSEDQLAEIDGFVDQPRSIAPVELDAAHGQLVSSMTQAYARYQADGQLVDLGEIESEILSRGHVLRAAIVRRRRSEIAQTESLEQSLEKAREDVALTQERLSAERDLARDALKEADERLSAERDEARKAHKNASRRADRWQTRARSAETERDELRAENEYMVHGFKSLEQAVAAYRARADELEAERDEARGAFKRVEHERLELERLRDGLTVRLHAIEHSTFWRLGRPLRTILNRLPFVATGLRRVMKFTLWTLTGQLGVKLKARKQAAEAAQRAGAPAANHAFHGSRRAFIEAEFSSQIADQIDHLIDHYGLSFQTEGQPPIKLEIADAQARTWAKRLADLAPRASKQPDVSIIVPAYNQIAYTLACIESVFVSKPDTTFEILVGDDQSKDGTRAASKIDISGVRWVRHAQNQGFVGNCNLTAAQARGRIVVLLNNDTLVLPGWLDELVDTLDADDTIGLVGSKLVYPDGRLQEAGGIFWQDGSAWNLGRFDHPRRPELSYARDVDYISGAAIALRKSFWDQLDGFDDHYRPAYAEDADLAFRVRAAGKRTVFQPRSMLFHFEGVTSGTDLSGGAKAYQVTNLEKLKERWADELATHRPNGLSPELEKERAVSKRALFVDITTPEPQHDAGSLVAVETMRALQVLGHKVSFVPQDNFLWTRSFSAPLQRMGVEVIYQPFYVQFDEFMRARGAEFDLVVIHRLGAAERVLSDVRRYAPQARVAFLPADLHFLREEREADLSDDKRLAKKADETRKREIAVIKQVDAVLPHSTLEVEMLERDVPQTPAYLLPLIHDPEPTPSSFAERAGVGFIGGYGHPPNTDAVEWFVEAVWPLVRAQIPQARFALAGSKMPDHLKALNGQDGIEVLGFVESLTDFFDGIRVSVAPLRFGAGAKGKVAASLAYGTPCVTTPIGSEGMGMTAGRDIDVCETPEAIAETIIKLMTDEVAWQTRREAGLAFADHHTSRQVVRDRLESMLKAFAGDSALAKSAE